MTQEAETPPPDDALDLESALSRLEALVDALEAGELPLEQSLSRFENGVALVRRCQRLLTLAEQRVEQITSAREGVDITPFKDDESA